MNLASFVSGILLFPWMIAGRETLRPSMALIKKGFYRPLYLEPLSREKLNNTAPKARGDEKVLVKSFLLDRYPVTRSDFKKFVLLHPEWSRSQIKKLYADINYLKDWESDLDPGLTQNPQSPVRYISWFSARAYCKINGKRLPTLAEWEYAGSLYERISDLPKAILDWYSHPTPNLIPKVGSTFANDFGVYDLHGLIWEWVEDFNSSLVTGESREDASLDRGAFCGSGGLNASNFKDYAAFMRFGFRSSLNGSFAISNLGFRCAKDLKDRPND
jgi:formylglycine-generating enzyme required for sulfatase activity